ncbi:MAG TPA: DUF6538 domain-containing protein [Desulfuromonadaceae bacterium]
MVYTDSYLYLSRHNIYYFRAIVPHGIREGLHRREYRRSMQTRSIHVARNMARVLRVSFESNLEGLRSCMTNWDELRKILDNKLEQLILQERECLKKIGTYPLAANDIWKEETTPNYLQAIQTISKLRSNHILGISSGVIPDFARNLAEDILQSNNINLDKSSELFMQFCEATVQIYLEYTQHRIILNDEARSFQLDQPAIVPSFTTSHKQVHSMLISEVAETYCKDVNRR